MTTESIIQAGTISPDGHYVYTGFEWVLREQVAPVKKSHTKLWIGVGIAAAVGAGALVMAPGFQQGFKAGYAASAGWTASSLEDSIRDGGTLLASGSEIRMQAVDCVETNTDNWFVCSWRQQGDSTAYIYTVETAGSQWQSSDALLPGTVSDLSEADINSLA